MTHYFKQECLKVFVADNRDLLGAQAADMIASCIRTLLANQDIVNMIFAAAPSQNEMLASLIDADDIDWSRVNAFHMDEYIGLPADAPQAFSMFLKQRLFDKLPFHSVNYLNGSAGDPAQECKRYTALLNANLPDIVCMGIGENTHIAFNDPHVADLNDSQLVKIVTLDEVCRQQQVNDGCFNSLNDVPQKALTLTVPALMQAHYIYCVVPGSTKASAVKLTLHQPVSNRYPSTALKNHHAAVLFVDKESAALL
ncbi:MAG: glucosamine-6-phosphate deaminase [Mucilaginibacter sp.]|nr:glucosamine-6-phosphate deaminase [Mucilaginibacter sp.]